MCKAGRADGIVERCHLEMEAGQREAQQAHKTGWSHKLLNRIRLLCWRLAGYFYLAGWCSAFWLKLRVAPYLAYVVAFVSVVEVLLAVLDNKDSWRIIIPPRFLPLLNSFQEHVASRMILEGKWLVAFSVMSVAIVVFMALHHHLLEKRLEGYHTLVSSLRRLLVDGTDVAVSDELSAPGVFIERALQMLHSTREVILAATVLQTDSAPGSAFLMLSQYPPNTYQWPKEGLPEACAAGQALSTEGIQKGLEQGLVYIPWTTFPHGVRIGAKEGTYPPYREFDIVEDVFMKLNEKYGTPPVSTICAKIPVKNASKVRYVLCLDGGRRNCFKDVDFQAVQAVASVISLVLPKG